MELMGVVAVMVNLAMLGMGGSVQRMFPNMTVTDRIVMIVVLEVYLLNIFTLAGGIRGTALNVHRKNMYLTSLPLVSVRRHGRARYM